MVGDSLATDIKFGNTCAIDTWLVLSGVTTHKKAVQVMLHKNLAPRDGLPTYVSPTFGHPK